MNELKFYLILIVFIAACSEPVDISWPVQTSETKPGTRWWWLGSAVDPEGLTANMEDLFHAGIGSVEITPVYGINGAEDRHIDYLSPRWMNMYRHVRTEGDRLGINVDMNMGTGWPFGGPAISIEDAACKVFFRKYMVKGGTYFEEQIIPENPKQKDIASVAAIVAYSGDGVKKDLTGLLSGNNLKWEAPSGEWTVWAVFNGKTLQKVKRAAPGGEGFVMDHYSGKAVQRYLKHFDDAFNSSNAQWPDNFFNDSYEVYGADWSDNLFDEFEKRRGYKLQDFIPQLNREGDPDICARIITDYRQTIADLLLHEFTVPWTEWAHGHGVGIRNQAHGSPGNLIDFYAAVDIPECESFGRTLFDIPGLRVDSGMKESDSHPSVLKYASSAAHITGKRLVSSETFTWLTEHFRTSLSQMKPELDLLFVSGVNHMYYHGSPYSPKDVAWPGWLFYATVNMNANNTIFRDARGLNDYISRTQSFLQYGEPDNDFLLYLPFYDVWMEQGGLYLLFDIHKMKSLMPEFFKMVINIRNLGYDTDYISDKYLQETHAGNGCIQTAGAAYKAIIVPAVKYMPETSFNKLLELAGEGATVIFAGQLPDDVPGFYDFEKRRTVLNQLIRSLPGELTFRLMDSISYGKGKIIYGTDYSQLLNATGTRPEDLPVLHGAGMIRRKHPQGHHYFITMLCNQSIDGWVGLAVNARSAVVYNPLTGESGKAALRKKDGKTEVYLQLEPGRSVILKTFEKQNVHMPGYPCYKKEKAIPLSGNWSFAFTDGMPAVEGSFAMPLGPVYWTELENDSARVYAGTGRYSFGFELDKKEDEYLLDLGHLCESARVFVNKQDAGLVWSLPYTLKIGKYLKDGINNLEINVTNLPANRIRDYDRRNVNWRIFKDINIVSVFYKDIRFDNWDVAPSGLSNDIQLIPLSLIHQKY